MGECLSWLMTRRENEGDLVIPAQMATPDAINWPLMVVANLPGAHSKPHQSAQSSSVSQTNTSRHETAFDVDRSKEGVTTGISASDRARTIAVAIDATKGPEDIGSPGHVFLWPAGMVGFW